MAIDTPTRPSGRSGGSAGRTEALRVIPATDPGTRRDVERVSLVVPDALAPWMEVVSIADDVIASAERILMAAAAGSRHAVVNEVGRLAFRVQGCRDEARRRIAAIEPDGAA